MEVVQLTKATYNQWDNFILQSPQYNLFAHTWYLNALEIKFEIYTVQVKKEIVGGIILPKDKWNYYINPIFGKYLGIFYGNFEGNNYAIESRKRKVQKALLPILKKLPSFEYTFHPAFNNWLQLYNIGFKQTTSYTYLINLNNQTEEDILNGMSPRLRNKILKVQQTNYTIKPVNLDEKTLSILVETYSTKGNSFPISIERLQKLVKTLNERNAIVFTGIFIQNELNAVLGLFYDVNTCYLILNGLSSSTKTAGVNELLIYNGIQWAKNKGLQTFDFEGSMISSIESFYRQFGGALTPYHKIWKESKQRKLRNLKQQLF